MAGTKFPIETEWPSKKLRQANNKTGSSEGLWVLIINLMENFTFSRKIFFLFSCGERQQSIRVLWMYGIVVWASIFKYSSLCGVNPSSGASFLEPPFWSALRAAAIRVCCEYRVILISSHTAGSAAACTPLTMEILFGLMTKLVWFFSPQMCRSAYQGGS